METNKNPIYTMSATLFNKLKWYKNQKTEEKKKEALEQMVTTLKKEFTDNKWTLRGQRFEKEVMEGKHPQMYLDIDQMKSQLWVNKYVDYADFTIKLTGKMDLYDPDGKQIYDIKRTNKYYAGKYGDNNTIQHDLYLYMKPEAERFWYSVAHGVDDKNIKYAAFPVLRKENEEQYIRQHIEELIVFLHENDLLELYFKNYEVNF